MGLDFSSELKSSPSTELLGYGSEKFDFIPKKNGRDIIHPTSLSGLTPAYSSMPLVTARVDVEVTSNALENHVGKQRLDSDGGGGCDGEGSLASASGAGGGGGEEEEEEEEDEEEDSL
jgi:hypothetical protein